MECVLPNWLACPKIISANLTFTTNVRDMALLDERLKEKLKKNGITQFFPGIKVFFLFISFFTST